MKISSDEIPQADRLTAVVRTVICIAQGGRTFQDIKTFINKGERQGRYYRKAAEILGLIETPLRNYSVLTPLGKSFTQSGAVLDNPCLIQAVFNARVFQRLLPYLELQIIEGVNRADIENFIVRVADIGNGSTARRRLSSVISWLEELQIIQRRNDRFYLTCNIITNSIKILNFANVDEPLLPRVNDLQEYQVVGDRVREANEIILIYKEQATVDRAENAHRKIVNLVANRIKNAGGIPRYNQLIDLAARIGDRDYIFEMKSLTTDNARVQIRNGLSQLYEYSYLQNLPNASLVLVVENQLPPSVQWMIEYLEIDREIYIVWNGGNNLHGTARAMNFLSFLNII